MKSWKMKNSFYLIKNEYKYIIYIYIIYYIYLLLLGGTVGRNFQMETATSKDGNLLKNPLQVENPGPPLKRVTLSRISTNT